MGVTDNRSVKAIRTILEVNKVHASPYIVWKGTGQEYGSKGKCKVNFALEQGTKAQRETRGIALLFL